MNAEIAKNQILEIAKNLSQSDPAIKFGYSISARIESGFVIAFWDSLPLSLKPEEFVVVNSKGVSENKYQKNLNEIVLHSNVYKNNNNNFVVHTKQEFATILASNEKNITIEDEENKAILGSTIPVLSYVPVATKKFTKKILSCLAPHGNKLVIIAQHGVICLGNSMDEIFTRIKNLEEFCKKSVFSANYAVAFDYTRQEKKLLKPLFKFYTSKRVGDFCFIYDSSPNTIICKMDIETGSIVEGDFDFPADLHCRIYSDRSDIHHIEQCLSPASLYISKKITAEQTIPAFLDDFAELVGCDIASKPFFENNAEELTNEIVYSLQNRNAILIEESGILCCGKTISDMKKLEWAVEKNSLAVVMSWKFESYKPFPLMAAKKLRKQYLKRNYF